MGADQNIDWREAAASALEWWHDAGVDALAGEAPRNWSAAVVLPNAATAAPAVAAPDPLPRDLAAFAAWRRGPDAPESGWAGASIDSQGSAAADIMILIDMPEREDGDGVLMGGAPGRLLDQMLAAIGRNRESIYLAPVCHKRPTAGRIAPDIEARLGEIARHHVLLAAPKRLLLLGNAASRAVGGTDVVRMRGGLRALNLESGTVQATIEAVASFHPRFLIERPTAKAEAWKDLQMLAGGLE